MVSCSTVTSPPRPHLASPADAAGTATLQRDRELIERWQRGDRTAGATLLEHYAGFAQQILRRHGIAADRLDECWQDLVLRVLQHLPDLGTRLRTSFAGYLAWQIRDLLRTWRRRSPHVAEDLAALATVPDTTARTAFWEAMQRCAGKLSPREQTIFSMRFLAGHDLSAVATSIASNNNAVAQAVFRLVRRLRECLQQSGFGGPGDAS